MDPNLLPSKLLIYITERENFTSKWKESDVLNDRKTEMERKVISQQAERF